MGHCPKVIFMYAIQGGRHNRIPANCLVVSEFSHCIEKITFVLPGKPWHLIAACVIGQMAGTTE
jgi:hypothetical protein